MAKIIHVAKAKKDQGTCYRAGCTVQIKAGDAYKHVTLKTGPRSSIRRVWCNTHIPRPSETTTARTGEVCAIGEVPSDDYIGGALRNLEDLSARLTDAVSNIESARDEFQSSFDNMPEGLQQGATGQLIQERIDGLEEWIQELKNAADKIKDMDPEGENAANETACATCGQPRADHTDERRRELDGALLEPCKTWLNPEVLNQALKIFGEAAGSCSL